MECNARASVFCIRELLKKSKNPRSPFLRTALADKSNVDEGRAGARAAVMAGAEARQASHEMGEKKSEMIQDRAKKKKKKCIVVSSLESCLLELPRFAWVCLHIKTHKNICI